MQTGIKFIMAVITIAAACAVSSCASTGQYMPLSKDEPVLGTAQAVFVVRSSLFFLESAKDAVNTHAYISLLEAAGQKYPGAVDVRDIVWVTGRAVDGQNTEVSATAKVVRLE
ncbi:MAG: hypothetical protein LBC88_05860 [Spirochaetaceae bacterium]|jgi:hypothetical protein|nr:hypothetical protein [Spirochaetaceae bacterium]